MISMEISNVGVDIVNIERFRKKQYNKTKKLDFGQTPQRVTSNERTPGKRTALPNALKNDVSC